MARIKILKDVTSITDDTLVHLYPVTVFDGVYNSDGETLTQVIERLTSDANSGWYGFTITKGQESTSPTPAGDPLLLATKAITALNRPCILNANGTVNYYLDKSDLTKREDGTNSNRTGTDGDVVTEIPTYFWKEDILVDQTTYKFSLKALDGFMRVPKHYISHYEGSLYGGTLKSISNGTPLVNKTRDEFRALANNRNIGLSMSDGGWCIEPHYIYEADYFLKITETLNLNFQETFGSGMVGFTKSYWEDNADYAPLIYTSVGNTGGVRDGHISFNQSISSHVGLIFDSSCAINWWIEHIYGNLDMFRDGINVYQESDGMINAYIATRVPEFADNTKFNNEVYAQLYTDTDYISKFADGSMLPSNTMTSGSSSQHCGDAISYEPPIEFTTITIDTADSLNPADDVVSNGDFDSATNWILT